MSDELPFSQPGRQLTGDGDAAALVAEAKRVLFLTKLIAKTAGVPVFCMTHNFEAGGRVSAQVAGDIYRIKAHRPAEAPVVLPKVPVIPGDKARLVWLPEGFVITPRTPSAPNGYGMPATADGKGTPGGRLTQVIINRFTGNQYPDAVYAAAGGIANADKRVVFAAPLFFMPWEMSGDFGIGIIKDGRLLPQFADHWTVNYKERSSGLWHCHRPTPAPRADDLVHKTMRDETNLLRASAGVSDANPPLRGAENILSEPILYLDMTAGVLGHDSRLFKPGYQDFDTRVAERCGITGQLEVGQPGSDGGENVYFTTALDTMTVRYGREVVARLRNSPKHYENMVTDWAANGAHYPVVESATRNNMGKLLTKKQQPPYSIDSAVLTLDPPYNGSQASQIFYGLQNWVVPSNNGQDVSDAVGIFGPFGTQGHAYFPQSYMLYIASGPSLVRFKGRSIEVHDNVAELFTVLAARIVRPGSGAVMLRVAGHARLQDVGGVHSIVVFEGLAHDFKATRTEVGRFVLPVDVGQIAFPKFSALGKMVFSYTRAIPERQVIKASRLQRPIDPGNAHAQGPMVTTTTADADAVWGEEIHFIQLSTGFSEIKVSGVDVAVHWWNDSTYSGDANNSITYGEFGMRRSCIGEYEVLADYDGETVVFAKAVVNTWVEQVQGHTYTETVKLRGLLRCPNGTELVYTQTDTAADYSVSGFFLHFLFVDILHPERTVTLRYDVAGGVRPTAAMTLATGAATVKTKANVLPAMDDPYWNFRRHIMLSGNASQCAFIDMAPWRAETTWYNATPSYRSFIRFNAPMTYYSAAVDHKPQLVTTASFSAAMQRRGSDGFTRVDSVGPSFIVGSPGSTSPAVQYQPILSYVNAAFYGGESLYAGKVDNSICLAHNFNNTSDAGNGWTGDAGYFWKSSLDLKAITGMADLTDNILPIGTL